jgi:hypothetical protein
VIDSKQAEGVDAISVDQLPYSLLEVFSIFRRATPKPYGILP